MPSPITAVSLSLVPTPLPLQAGRLGWIFHLGKLRHRRQEELALDSQALATTQVSQDPILGRGPVACEASPHTPCSARGVQDTGWWFIGHPHPCRLSPRTGLPEAQISRHVPQQVSPWWSLRTHSHNSLGRRNHSLGFLQRGGLPAGGIRVSARPLVSAPAPCPLLILPSWNSLLSCLSLWLCLLSSHLSTLPSTHQGHFWVCFSSS